MPQIFSSKGKVEVFIDEPVKDTVVINGIQVSGWCKSSKILKNVYGVLNKKDQKKGIVGIYRHDLKLPIQEGFSVFFPDVLHEANLELLFEFEDGSKEIFHKKLTLTVGNNISKTENLPYQLTLHNAAVGGKILKRDNIYGSGPPNPTADSSVLAMILNYTGNEILDVGSGIGAYVEALAQRSYRARGVEINSEYVQKGLSSGRDISLYDGRKISYDNNSFDTVISIEVLEHVENWKELLLEMIRVSRKNVLISVPNIGVIPEMSKHHVVPWHILELSHVNFFTREILNYHLKQIDGITFYISPYAPIMINGEVFFINLFIVIELLNQFNYQAAE